MKKFDQFSHHLEVLKKADREDLENEFIISGIIDKFYIQFELGWKVLKELLAYEGRSIASTGSPREIIKAAYSCFDFIDEVSWLEMLKERNDTTHIYNEDAARKLIDNILNKYIKTFCTMQEAIQNRYGEELSKIF